MSAEMSPANTKPFKFSKKFNREFNRKHKLKAAAISREIDSWNLTTEQLLEVVRRDMEESQVRLGFYQAWLGY